MIKILQSLGCVVSWQDGSIVIDSSSPEKPLLLKNFEFKNYPFWKIDSENELMEKAQAFLAEPLKPNEQLVRCAVFQTPKTSGIMISGQHIVVDGFSAYVMAEQINSFVEDENFSPSAIQKYCDYVANEEKHKNSKRYRSDEKFWIKQFSGSPQCTLFNNKHNDIFNYESSEINSLIPTELFTGIRTLCNNNDISVQSYFNTVLSVYIHRKLGFDKFTLGIPVLNRTTKEELNTFIKALELSLSRVKKQR